MLCTQNCGLYNQLLLMLVQKLIYETESAAYQQIARWWPHECLALSLNILLPKTICAELGLGCNKMLFIVTIMENVCVSAIFIHQVLVFRHLSLCVICLTLPHGLELCQALDCQSVIIFVTMNYEESVMKCDRMSVLTHSFSNGGI